MSWISLALLGGLVGLDATSFPQSMICRPLVAGALTGLLFGRPVEGLLVGLLMEVFSLVILPIGAARYPESGTATVAAVGAYLWASPAPEPSLLFLALAFGLSWEPVTGLSVVRLRRRTGRRLTGRRPARADEVGRVHLEAMTLDFLRGGLVALAGAVAGGLALRLLAPLWGLPATVTLGVLSVLVISMLGTASRLFVGEGRARTALVAGLGGGLLLALLVP